MPIMFVVYFLQSTNFSPISLKNLTDDSVMDKQTITLSSLFGISHETGLIGDDYSLVGSVL